MTFAAPLFLLGLLAGALPVFLHMIHRQKAPEIPFATLRFLQLSVHRTRRRKYIDDLALLVARVLILVLLAIALANPILTSLRMLLGQGRATAVAIILDNSTSMGTLDNGQARLETARQAAEQILDMLREGDAVAFLPTGGPPTAEQGSLYTQHETVRQAVAQCKVSHERADLPGKLQQARALLATSEIPNREIFVLTDNQALSWEGLEKSEDSVIPIIVIHVNHDPQPNVALRSVRLETPAPAVGVPIVAAVDVVNASLLPQPRNIELHLNGRKEAVSPTLNLRAGETMRHEFRFSVDRPGIHRGEIRLAEEDGCPHDNRLFFVAAVDQQISVAVVAPKRQELAFADDSFYLERVLSPTGGEGWAIRPQVITVDNLATEPLAGHAVVFCVNIPALEASLADKLRAYVEGGGHLFWIVGDNVQPDDYNRMNDKVGGKLLPAVLGGLRETASGKEGGKIAALAKDHPALRGLSEPASLYQSVLVHKHFPLTLPADQQTRVLAQLEGGQPLLVERQVGTGSVLLLGTAAHVDWTNLPVRPIFLPLMARLTFRLAGVEADRAHLQAGRPLLLPVPGQLDKPELEIITPAGDKLHQSTKPDGRTLRYAATHDTGIYLFRWLNAQDAKPIAIAVNGDPDESDPASLPREDLTQKLGRDGVVFCDNPADVAGAIRRLREGQSLWEFFLILVLIGLLVEAYLANWHRRKPEIGTPPQTPQARGRTT